MELITTFLYILFVLSAIVLVVVILLQEGKGGGLTSALGTSGQQTFGVGASGINKFTGWCGAIFMLSALGIHYLNRIEGGSSVVPDFGQPQVVPPVDGAGDGGAPGAGTSTPPPASGDAPVAPPPEQPK